MPDQPDYFADRPDALSDILETIRLRGDESVRHQTDDGALHQHPRGSRLVHLVVAGDVTVRVGRRAGTTVGPGGMAMVARGDAHTVRVRGAATWVTGRFDVDEVVADPLLGVLPPVVVIPGNVPGREWLPLSIDLLLTELDAPRPGSRVMVSRILDLLFVHALRAWAAEGHQDRPGWLTAAMDPSLAPVLTAIHATPEHPWTLESLARIARLSRSAFAARFTLLMGQAPAAYVTRQRLDRAAHLLRSTTEPVGSIAQRVGYTSDASFSRAFSRRYGAPPRAWRAKQQP